MQKILLIGNGPSALSMELGEEIDKFPLVVRFNAYVIKGFEKYVGSKTDVWITCSSHPRWRKDYKKVWLCSYARNRPNKILDSLRMRYPDIENFPEWVWKETLTEMDFIAPSSGAVAATYFVREYETYIYGFDFFNGEKHHYSDKIPMGINHSANKEVKYFTNLFQKGKAFVFHNYLDNLNYQILHKSNPAYGVGGNWFYHIIKELVVVHDCKTILDYGCGKGGLVKLLNCEGYDPYVERYKERPAGCFDMLVSTDLLEHIEDISTVFSDMQSYQPKIMFHAVSNRYAAQILPDGTNAHKTIESPDWWLEKFKNSFPQYNVSIKGYNEKQNFTMYILERKNGL